MSYRRRNILNEETALLYLAKCSLFAKTHFYLHIWTTVCCWHLYFVGSGCTGNGGHTTFPSFYALIFLPLDAMATITIKTCIHITELHGFIVNKISVNMNACLWHFESEWFRPPVYSCQLKVIQFDDMIPVSEDAPLFAVQMPNKQHQRNNNDGMRQRDKTSRPFDFSQDDRLN